MLQTYQYRIYPTAKQRLKFDEALDACRQIYNQALDIRKSAYDERKESISYNIQQKMLTELRRKSNFWSSIHIDILQDALRRSDKAFSAFFRRVKKGETPGYPRFKGEGRYRSFTYSHLSQKLIRYTKRRLDYVVVPQIGKVKIRLHRTLPEGKIRTLRILCKASGWYADISVKVPDVKKIEIQSVAGVDVGLESFLTTSDGDKIENPRHLRQSEKKLTLKQRKLSKRVKGSNRRLKARHHLALLHEHIANQRKDFHYKTSHWLYSFYDAIVVENLQIANMVKNHHLAKSISDASWGNFVLSLASKAEKAGKHLIKVDPKYTSQKCSQCGETVKKSLSVRTHQCYYCGLVLDRDENAAINILRAATALRGGDGLPSPLNREVRNACIVEPDTGQLLLFQAPREVRYRYTGRTESMIQEG